MCSADNPNNLSPICMLIFDHKNQRLRTVIVNISLQPSWHVRKWIIQEDTLCDLLLSSLHYLSGIMWWFQKWISLLKTKRNTPYLRSRLTTPSLRFECFRRKQSIFAVTQNHPLPTFLSSFGKSLFFLVTTGLNRRRRDVSAPLDNNSVANFVFSNCVWEYFYQFFGKVPCYKRSR